MMAVNSENAGAVDGDIEADLDLRNTTNLPLREALVTRSD